MSPLPHCIIMNMHSIITLRTGPELFRSFNMNDYYAGLWLKIHRRYSPRWLQAKGRFI